MKPIFNFIIQGSVPENLNNLLIIANNYWWSWNNSSINLFEYIDKQLFKEFNNNPILLINNLSKSRVIELSNDDTFVGNVNDCYEQLKKYLDSDKWYKQKYKQSENLIAYFSPEFGIHESFPNYSGGLGVLSGDHLKSASDLGVPLVGISLLYQEGYFHQVLTQNGWQSELYPENDFYSMPITMLKDKSDKDIIIEVKIGDNQVYAKVWCLLVGRVKLYLLDTNIEKNLSLEDREITHRLYGGDRSTRIKQEILLGIGGVKVLDALKLKAKVIHINEGHAGFALLERTKYFMKEYDINFWEASHITIASSVFTTHTPVPAGNEVFDYHLVKKYLSNYCSDLNIEIEHLYYLAKADGLDKFSMTVLALNLSALHNGVSKLHGETSRHLWKSLWKNFSQDEIPIKHITNGVHKSTWISQNMQNLMDKHSIVSDKFDLDASDVCQKLDQIPNQEIQLIKKQSRKDLIDFCRLILSDKNNSYMSSKTLKKIDNILDYDTLTIGFARRFAAYKRAFLLFQDMPRLKEIILNDKKPVQIILSGKAHPHDTAGKETIQHIIRRVKDYHLENNIIFLEDYDMVIAKHLVQGCDLWLNTPIKPLEASGTSGMKVAINGGLNFSILDGWWEESYDGKNGFTIGNGEIYDNFEEQNSIESNKLYELLENEIIDKFYDRDVNGVASEWYDIVKNNFYTICDKFNSHRMLREYSEYYNTAEMGYKDFTDNNASNAVALNLYKDKLIHNWELVNVFDTTFEIIDNQLRVGAKLYYAELKEYDLKVQAVYGVVNSTNNFDRYSVVDMEMIEHKNKISSYALEIDNNYTGRIGLTFRIVPNNNLLKKDTDLKMCKWAEK